MRFSPASRRLDFLTWLYIAASLACLLFLLSRPLHSGVFWMEYMQDDFFYYLKIAQNIADGHGSTFNGLVPTNGYHPLYEAVLVVASKLTRSSKGILLTQAALIFAAAIGTFAAARALLNRAGVSGLVSLALALLLTTYALRLFYLNMEITLTIPLALTSLLLFLRPSSWLKSGRQALLLGLLFALTILSRLDSMLLISLWILVACASPAIRAGLTRPSMLGFALGLSPVAVYFLLNHHMFGTWLPVSGMAKQLKPTWFPVSKAWQVLQWWEPGHVLVMSTIPLAIFLLFKERQRRPPLERGAYLAVLLSPWLYFLVLCCLSDWPLWGWYLYYLRLAQCVSFVVLCSCAPVRAALRNKPVQAFLSVLALLALSHTRWPIQFPDLYAGSRDIERFAEVHPGVYAMGDRSGSVGFLIHSPVVQTEGLVMDKNFLQNIRRQRPLLDVLREYGVRYYVTTPVASSMSGNCLRVAEPHQGGPASPKMRATLCDPPVLTVEHSGATTYIFDLAQKSGS